MMCCYKVARLDVSANGLPGRRIEMWGMRHGVQKMFIHYNRQVVCWMDAWLGLGIGDVDGFGETWRERGCVEKAAAVVTEIAAESSAGLAFAFSDETNPFFA